MNSQLFKAAQNLRAEDLNHAFRHCSRAIGGGILHGLGISVAGDRLLVDAGVYQTPNGVLHTVHESFMIGTGGLDTSWTIPAEDTDYTILSLHETQRFLAPPDAQLHVFTGFLGDVTDTTILGWVRQLAGQEIGQATIIPAPPRPHKLPAPVVFKPEPRWGPARLNLANSMDISLELGTDNQPYQQILYSGSGSAAAVYDLPILLTEYTPVGVTLDLKALPNGCNIAVELFDKNNEAVPLTGIATRVGDVTDSTIELGVQPSLTTDTTPGTYWRVRVTVNAASLQPVWLGDLVVVTNPFPVDYS